jgi:hypothetical protein
MRHWIHTLAVLAPAVFATPALLAQAPAEAPKADAPQAAEEKKAEVVDFRKLKELLPANLGGLKRTQASGERNQMDKFAISQASGEYGEGEKTFSLQILDYGTTSPLLEMVKAMMTVEVDRETDKEYEKSIKVEGHPGLERYNSEDKYGNATLYVSGRYVVELSGNGLSKEEFQKAIKELPIKKLAELK